MPISSGGKPCSCNKCGAEAVTFAGTQHRRCVGHMPEGDATVKLRDRRDKLTSDKRGTWN